LVWIEHRYPSTGNPLPVTAMRAANLRAICMRRLEVVINNDSTQSGRQNENESGVSFWQVPS
jgi:hypothetical protein